MKRIISFVFILFFFSKLVSNEYWIDELEKCLAINNELKIWYGGKLNKFYYEPDIQINEYYSNLPDYSMINLNIENDLKLDEQTGFITFSYNHKLITFIPSKARKSSIFLEKKNNQISSCTFSQEYLHLQKTSYPDTGMEYYFEIKNISVSSYLTERTKNGIWKYDGQDIERFPILHAKDLDENYFENIPMPWVEGKEDDGIGEWISFNTHRLGVRTLYIVNGFVDIRRPHLFKENNRVKNATLICKPADINKEPFEIKIEFKDFVYTKTIELPERCISFKLIIDSVYKGSKYSDTVITSIYTPNTEDTI